MGKLDTRYADLVVNDDKHEDAESAEEVIEKIKNHVEQIRSS
jgi:predicted small metal-binding protein